jgi:medium-chain acyl-[acyl-carrier-protein] hydrolase
MSHLAQSMQAWLIRPCPNPSATLRLFCLPHAGGAAAQFRTWPAALPADVEVCAVQLPGRETRFKEAPFTRWQPLVSALADLLAANIDRPYALFGHSMGALLAFELARRIRQLDCPAPAHLFAAAHRAPHVPAAEPPIHALPDAAFRAELRRRKGTPDLILDNDEMMQALSPMLRADFAICETYTYQAEAPLDCPLSALGGQTDASVPPDHLAEWSALTSSAFESVQLPGGHFFPTTQQASLLEYLRGVLGRVLGEHRTDWQKPAAVPTLSANEVHVWRLPLDHSEEQAARLLKLLDAQEQERAQRFRFPADHNRFVVGRALMRTLLGQYVGEDPTRLQFSYASVGKPFLRDHGLQFNLAHSGNLALLAVAGRRAVGVDVEQVRASIETMTIAERYFAPDELALLRAVPPERQRLLFFRIWTRKEAYMKATGLGLYTPLEEFGVLPASGRPSLRLQLQKNAREAARWALRDLEPGAGYTGAVAVAGHGWHLRCMDVPDIAM